MVGGLFRDRWVAPLLIALAVAGLSLRLILPGNYCLVPSEFLQPGEAGSAQTSVYGVVLYRESGTDVRGMYEQAVWWHEIAIEVEWGIATVAETAVYLVLRVRQRGPRQGAVGPNQAAGADGPAGCLCVPFGDCSRPAAEVSVRRRGGQGGDIGVDCPSGSLARGQPTGLLCSPPARRDGRSLGRFRGSVRTPTSRSVPRVLQVAERAGAGL